MPQLNDPGTEMKKKKTIDVFPFWFLGQDFLNLPVRLNTLRRLSGALCHRLNRNKLHVLSYSYVSCSGSITSIWEERANLSAIVYL